MAIFVHVVLRFIKLLPVYLMLLDDRSIIFSIFTIGNFSYMSCVLVKDGGEIVAQGFTQALGRHHAEASALEAYSSALKDTSDPLENDFNHIVAYVTLAP